MAPLCQIVKFLLLIYFDESPSFRMISQLRHYLPSAPLEHLVVNVCLSDSVHNFLLTNNPHMNLLTASQIDDTQDLDSSQV